MKKTKLFSRLKQEADHIIHQNEDAEIIYTKIVELLDHNVCYYHWTGFYLVENNALTLGPFIGKPTDHVRIQIGQGICGQAAALKKTIIIDDVSQEDNYLACSLETKSEIVVPILKDNEILGEIDIDSDQIGAFDEQDAELLEYIANLIAQRIA